MFASSLHIFLFQTSKHLISSINSSVFQSLLSLLLLACQSTTSLPIQLLVCAIRINNQDQYFNIIISGLLIGNQIIGADLGSDGTHLCSDWSFYFPKTKSKLSPMG